MFIKIILSLLVPLYSLSVSAQIYGIVKANGMYAGNPVNSFSNVNMSAPTAATNRDLYPGEGGDRSTFQVVQSRFGGKFKPNDKVLVLMEMDFIDFGQSSPTTSSKPRLRRALIGHELSDKFSIQIGQDWDLFSGMNSKTFNFIGNYFQAGNAGFMRQQFIGHYKMNKDRLSFSIAQAGNSSAAVDTELENDNRSSLSLVYELNRNNSKWQFGAVGAQKTFNNQNKNVWGLSLGLTQKIKNIKFTFESYYGEALSKLAMLTLPSANFAHEFGAYLTLSYELDIARRWYVGAGYAGAKDPGSSNYDTTIKKFTTIGANKNTSARLGYGHLIDGVEYYTEVSHFSTEYRELFQVNTLELGGLIRF